MKKVLIIEDDPIVAHTYQTRLEKEGYQVEVVQDGQSGYYRIMEFLPDAVVLDLMLPKMNGVEVLKKIRAVPQFAKTPIVVFTNAYVPNMIQESFQAGATQVFNKSTLTPRQLAEALFFSQTLPGSGAPQTIEPAPAGSERPVAGGAAGPPSLGYDQAGDRAFQAELQRAFSAQAPETLGGLRKCLQEFIKAQALDKRLPCLLELYRKVHALTSRAGTSGLRNISHMGEALEVLLKELYENPKNINASTLRTVAHSIDFIGRLFSGPVEDLLASAPVQILVVDDEILSRRAVTYALEKANLKCVSVEDPQLALKHATKKTFDLIFLDVQMPGMDGFDLCTKIRAQHVNRTTAVVFVTSLTDFTSRARSSLSGGNDFIAKPFMFIELSVKALTYVLAGRLATYRMAQAA